MKKMLFIVSTIIVILSMPYMLGFSIKDSACKISCEEAFKKCKKEVGEDSIKEAACKTAYSECLKKCEKQD